MPASPPTLWHLTGNDDYRLQAEDILAAFAGDAGRNAAGHATLLLAATLLAQPVQIVVVGDDATPGFAAAVRRRCRLGRPSPHPAAGRARRPVAG